MSEFEAKIQATLDTDEAKISFETFKTKLENEVIKVQLDADFTEDNSNFMKNLKKNFQSAGTQTGKNFGKSFSNGLTQNLGKINTSKFANNIASQFGIKSKDVIKEISNQYSDMTSKLMGGDTASANKNVDKIHDIVSKNANVTMQRTGTYDDFYSWFKKSGKIKVPDEVINDIGKQEWDRLRKMAPTIFSRKDGIELDSFYGETYDQFKGLLSGSATGSAQLVEICGLIENYKKDISTPVDSELFDNDIWTAVLDSASEVNKQVDEIKQNMVNKQIQEQNKEFVDQERYYQNERKRLLQEGAKQEQEYYDGLATVDAYKQVEEANNAEKEYQEQRAKYIAEGNKQAKESEESQRLVNKQIQEQNRLNKEAFEEKQKYQKKEEKFVKETVSDTRNNISTGKYDSESSNMSSELQSYIGKDSDVLQKARQEATEYLEISEKLKRNFDKNDSFKLDDSQIVSFSERLNTLSTSFKNTMTQVKNDVSLKTDLGFDKQFDNLTNKFNSVNTSFSTLQNNIKNNASQLGSAGYEKITQQINQAEQAQQRFNAELAKGANANLDNLNADLKEFKRLADSASREYQKLTTPASAIKTESLKNKILAWGNENTRAVKAGKTTWDSIVNSFGSGDLTTGQLDDIYNRFKSFSLEMKAAGKTGKSFFQELGRGFKQIGQFATTYGLIEKIPEKIEEMYQNVVEVDTAMTSLYKVTDETSQKYDAFLDGANEKAKSLGRDISSYIEQTATWAKLGYSMDFSSNLAKVSSIYANVGEVDDETAVSYLVTAMKAYNISAEDAMSVADSYNELGNTFATDAASLGEGISNAASSLAVAGNDFNQSVAMITGMSEITQEAGEAGNALKILSMRVRGYDEETEGYTLDIEELSGSIADLTKTASTPGGISLFTDETKETYKSTYQLLEEISAIYDELTDKDQAALLETLAGKNRGNQISALIQAFQSGQVQKAYETSINSAGSAMKEQERWMESLEAKTQQFKAALQELSITAINSDFAKNLIDSGTSLLELFTKIIDKLGTFKTLFAAISGGFLTKNGFGKHFVVYNAPLYKIA